MDSTIREIIDKYRYDQKTKKYSNKHFFNDNSYFRKISSRSDVSNSEIYLKNTINYFKKIYPLTTDDIIDMEKALGKYEIAVHKVLQCYDNFDFNYSVEELMELINNINKYEESISEINLRKMCQD
jgi:methionyl-tRNA synthetase